MRKALRLVNNPEQETPTVIVGGTNGKGSTTAMIGSIIRHAEYSVGCYYSPHISDVRERIELNGEMISKNDMARLIGYVREKTDRLVDLTYFEFLTLSAYCWFAEKKAALGVIEVGMGGRFDATNVTNALVSVITTVSLDHTGYLGNTTEKIAGEKALIVPEGGSLVAGRVDAGVKRVLKNHARRMHAEAFFLDEDFRGIEITGEESGDAVFIDYRGMAAEYNDIRVPIVGSHHVDNAAVAMAVTEILGRRTFSVSEQAVRQGLGKVRIPGRIERIAADPEVIVDVAHNPAGARVLADYIGSLPKKKTAFVVGMMGDKDITGFLKKIDKAADMIVLAAPHVERAAPLRTLEEAAGSCESPIRLSGSIREAVTEAKKAVEDGGRVVITGSFYTVQEALHETPDTP